MGSANRIRADIDSRHREARLVQPPGEPARAAAHVEQPKRWISGGRLLDCRQERVELRRRSLARNHCGIEPFPVFACVTHRRLVPESSRSEGSSGVPVSVTARDAQHGHLDDQPFSEPVALT